MLAEIPCEEIAQALDCVAEAILCDAGVVGPPIDAFALAARLGIAVASDDRQAGRARYVRLRDRTGRGPRPAILLRADPRREREHWAVAHEIGEHAAHRVFRKLGVDVGETPAARESAANDLAARLLLPGAWFHLDARACGWNLPVLKRRYATASHELIARRMLDFPPPVIVTIHDNGRLTFRRSNVPGRVPPSSPEEIACRQAAHDTAQPQQTAAATHTVRAWPVHEEEWKREILRIEVEAFDEW